MNNKDYIISEKIAYEYLDSIDVKDLLKDSVNVRDCMSLIEQVYAKHYKDYMESKYSAEDIERYELDYSPFNIISTSEFIDYIRKRYNIKCNEITEYYIINPEEDGG